jgi:hypothetical protein
VQTLDREQQTTLEQFDPGVSPSDSASPSPPRRTVSMAWVLRWSMALLMLGAAGIHFAAMGEHAGVSWSHGLFFGLAAWAQVMVAGLLVLGPARRSIQLAIVVNFAIIVVWLVSRTVGIAIGTDGDPEPVEFADTLCTVFEGLTIALGLMVICGGFARRRIRLGAGWGIGAFVAVVVAALTSFGFTPAIADSSGDGHSHAGGGAEVAAAGSAPAAAAPAAHTHGSTELTDLNGHVIKGVKAQDIAAEAQPDVPLDAATRATLQQQLVVARDTAMRYPTTADAVAAGYHVVGGFGPGSGAHYIGGYGGVFGGGFDPSKPLALIYDGASPTSQMVGLMYYAMGNTAPEGFAGPNDHWHRHSNVCTRGAEVLSPPDADISREDCAALGGFFMTITGWMVHAWVVPSWESPDGVFSHENPNLRCADGTFNTDKIGACQGS